jgi:hypothetical protein
VVAMAQCVTDGASEGSVCILDAYTDDIERRQS